MSYILNPFTSKFDFFSTSSGSVAIGGAVSGATPGYILYTDSSGNLAQDTTAGGQLFWDATNHKLGIGTTTFGTLAKLTINPNTTTNNSAIAQINTINTTDDALVLNMVASPTGNAVNVTNNSGTTVARLTSLGKMALGSSVAPVSQLYIQATSAAQGFIVGNVDSVGGQTHFGICTGNSGSISGDYWNSFKDANGWIFNSSNSGGTTRRMRFLIDGSTIALSMNTDGTVAVGLLNPSAQFEVDNGANARSIFVAKDNTSAVFSILDGGNVSMTQLVSTYKNIATTNWGVPASYGTVKPADGQTGAVTLSSYTVGAADGSFYVSANINVTTSTTHNFTVTCVYTDESNTSRTLTLPFTQLTGSTLLTAITNVTGAGPYESPIFHIRCKASTSITIATTGTFTTVTYNGSGYIAQIA